MTPPKATPNRKGKVCNIAFEKLCEIARDNFEN